MIFKLKWWDLKYLQWFRRIASQERSIIASTTGSWYFLLIVWITMQSGSCSDLRWCWIGQWSLAVSSAGRCWEWGSGGPSRTSSSQSELVQVGSKYIQFLYTQNSISFYLRTLFGSKNKINLRFASLSLLKQLRISGWLLRRQLLTVMALARMLLGRDWRSGLLPLFFRW